MQNLTKNSLKVDESFFPLTSVDDSVPRTDFLKVRVTKRKNVNILTKKASGPNIAHFMSQTKLRTT